jgi:DNA-directed RNA polymerase specialized sigma24 family protein
VQLRALLRGWGASVDELERRRDRSPRLDEAARVALEHYRVEVYSFLCARLGGESDAHEVFAQVSEDLWRGIEGFRW